jgi:asparagine synthase (glutamine-hydrolysing)
MCGISGVLQLQSKQPIEEQKLNAMLQVLRHRGPDGEGIFIDSYIGLGHRRLSILDLSENGKQPFSSYDNRLTITYNGEIFNFKELRADLEKRGYKFRSGTDTEVLLYMYDYYGEDALDQLNGMFAFAIWDKQNQKLFIARDRVGIKPFYYSIYNGTLYFASEPKAIFAAGIPADLNDSSFTELLLFRYVAGEQTVFKHVKRLLPGHSITIENGQISNRRWWNLSDKILTNREKLPKNPFEWFSETFSSAVQYRTISDVPVGLMLSGGLDSSSIAASLQDNGHKELAAFTVIFEDPMYNEGPLAKAIAEKFGFDYHGIALEGTDLFNMLEEAAWLYDEPLVHQNDAQMLALSKYAKKHVTVLLSGEGADELMGGYFRYKALMYPFILNTLHHLSPILQKLPGSGIVNRFDKLSRYLKEISPESLVLFNVSTLYPYDLNQLGVKIDLEQFEYRISILKEAQSLYPKELSRQAMYLDLFTHMSSVLDRNDRMTMGASIECRVPFLDYRFLEMIPALPSDCLLKGKKGKWLLFNSVSKRLPDSVRNFRKLGFSVPWSNYMNNNSRFMSYLENFENDDIFGLPVFNKMNPALVKSLYKKGYPVGETLIRNFFMMSIWNKAYLSKVQKN